MTHDEIQSEYVDKMGSELGRLAHELRDQLSWLERKWAEFEELYMKGEGRIELLNRAASNFFYFLQQLMYEDAMLHLARLTDPAKTNSHENLTVLQLAVAVPDPKFQAKVDDATRDVLTKCQFARDWRNKKIAHSDLKVFRAGHAKSLPSVKKTDVDDAIESLLTLLASVDAHYGIPHSISAGDPWGAKSLLDYLEQGDRSIEAEYQASLSHDHLRRSARR